jgi:hypothetical protein
LNNCIAVVFGRGSRAKLIVSVVAEVVRTIETYDSQGNGRGPWLGWPFAVASIM